MDISRSSPIGVMDSGVGGLTVVRRLRRIMPEENIVFFGDSANCPYGNRSSEEVLALSTDMVRFLEDRGAKCIVIACNTMSSLVDALRRRTRLPVVSIVESAGEYIAARGIESAGLIATVRTVDSGIYEECIRDAGSACRIVSRSSPVLAELIESGCFDSPVIREEIRTRIGSLLAEEPMDKLILGCTHYPLAEDVFRRLYPGLELIDPALAQAEAVKKLLADAGLLNTGGEGRLSLFCSAGERHMKSIAEKVLDLSNR